MHKINYFGNLYVFVYLELFLYIRKLCLASFCLIERFR